VLQLGLVAVTGPSMLPTLHPGDWLLVRYGADVRSGDLVVVALPDRPLSVKRAVRRDGDRWWVEGDNAAFSTDSRTLGAVPVLARVLWRYWPIVRRLA
jgi:phage repressor protein C with HTH and peptisase S24 domain